jgi:hypothetical protein
MSNFQAMLPLDYPLLRGRWLVHITYQQGPRVSRVV